MSWLTCVLIGRFLADFSAVIISLISFFHTDQHLLIQWVFNVNEEPGPKIIKLFSSSAQLSMKFQ